MKKFLSLIIVILLIVTSYFCYYSYARKSIIDDEILKFQTNKLNLEKSKTDFLDGNYIRCATLHEDDKPNDTIYNDKIEFDYKKIQVKWIKKFPNNSLNLSSSEEKIGINNLNKIDSNNLYRLIIASKTVKNKIFSKGFSIEQKINYKKKDTLVEFISTKEYWWNSYKWELKKKVEYQNLYYKMY